MGVLNVHLYRPFSVKHFIEALPPTVKHVAVLDRTKEPGSAGEPLYQDVVTAISEGQRRKTERDRRSLWPVIQGIYPGDGESRLR